eukprot:gnl/MRDRNA2_/MRDRNA2_127401_c0_seq1.p1 gnl/MRDRNA2_/MRDRNA2_127401_c0~~gnl/MRDRNA2_/MRDRNA2_127401_c0_seq1.p1  ORF type:complete len:390 (+),score=80.28 gnl/MRDRNA2_/MRDRNA2_127401_c0_seq1:52-1170(+)
MSFPSGDEWTASLKALGDTPGPQRCQEALSPASGPVCVTGASGFIALHLVEQLLAKGYTVVGTVRSTDNAVKMAPLTAMKEKFGEEKLQIVGGVDCTKPDSFESAVKDCVGVFHTASPFFFKTDDPAKDLVIPAIEGTKGCLEACEKAGSVRRVIVTSSFAAVFNPGVYPWDYKYDCKDWNMTSQPNKDSTTFPEPAGNNAYRYSKIIAEKTAWDVQKKDTCPFDVATINPPMVIGANLNKPASVDDLNTSSAMILNILTGKMAPNPNSIGWVDVADVARAHIAAYEHPEAGGKRFLCAADEVPLWTDIAVWLKEMYPEAPVNTTPPEACSGLKMGLDCSVLKGLSGFKFTPLRDTLKTQCDSLLSAGFAKI